MWCTVKKLLGFVAQWIERLSPEQKVVGSIPIKPTSAPPDVVGAGLLIVLPWWAHDGP